MSEKMGSMQAEDNRPELEQEPQSPTSEVPGRASSSAGWKTPAIAGGAAFVGVRLIRIGLAGKILRVAFKLGRGPGGKIALSLAAKKMASRRRP
jgi:hypothetical protein